MCVCVCVCEREGRGGGGVGAGKMEGGKLYQILTGSTLIFADCIALIKCCVLLPYPQNAKSVTLTL